MILTILLSIMMMAGISLLLYAAVALIQDKRFFASAPKAVQESALPKKTFDILAFDWVLLCNAHFFPRYYPEVKPVWGATPVWL